MSGNMKFLYVGIAIALLLAILSPFIASKDPDGLESAASGIGYKSTSDSLKTEPVVSSPLPDYSIAGMGKTGEIVAIATGTIAILVISFGFGKIVKKKA
jgi:cobalt/nickel transport protein